MGSRCWHSKRRTVLLFGVLLVLCGLILLFSTHQQILDDVNRSASYISINSLRQSLLQDPGSICNFPNLPVNSSSLMKFIKDVPPITCNKGGPDWAKCHGSRCEVKPEIQERVSELKCLYKDILWESDFSVKFGPVTIVEGSNAYILKASDFVEVNCIAIDRSDGISKNWVGYLIGIRDSPNIKSRISWEKLNGKAMRYNVLMFGFDSLSRNTFIRKLPKSYKVIKDELKAHILEGYNIVGDGTPQALIPILTGYTELELPDTRKRMHEKAQFVDVYPLIWNTFKENGYVTAFHEDTPNVGIFTYRLKGFKTQPTDHYMRNFLLYTETKTNSWSKYCNGEIPRHKLMMDYITQFMESYKKYPKFAFGFHGELSHDDYNLIQAADDDLVQWLTHLKSSKALSNTILILMSDHGHRFARIRDTLQGKQEERLPWFALVLPKDIDIVRPGASINLKDNTRRLTTPFDIHATFLDILGLNRNENYNIHSKILPRSLSLFGQISINRTCGQAGIEPHWCACLSWKSIPISSLIVQRSADVLVDEINKYIEPYKDKCAKLILDKIEWAMILAATEGLLGFKKTMDKDGFLPDLSARTTGITNIYQIKVRLLPGNSLFEASLSHNVDSDLITVKLTDVSRINKYGNQARCIYNDQPQLRKYCYCTKD